MSIIKLLHFVKYILGKKGRCVEMLNKFIALFSLGDKHANFVPDVLQ